MKRIEGDKVDCNLLHLNYVADLIFFDGPLLSVFQNSNQENYLYYWCDVDDIFNRWLVFRVLDDKLKKYIGGKISLRELIKYPSDGFLYSLDINDNLQVENTSIVKPNNLPLEYIPDSQSYYTIAELYNRPKDLREILGKVLLDKKFYHSIIHNKKKIVIPSQNEDYRYSRNINSKKLILNEFLVINLTGSELNLISI